LKIPSFETEHFYARYEFSSPYLLSTSDCESVSVGEVLSLGGTSLNELGSETLGYTESEGAPALRRAIAAAHGDVPSDWVLVLNAPIEGIFITMSALLDKSDRVVVLGPCYDALVNTPRHLSDHVELWMLEPDDGKWSLNFERLEELLEVPTKMLVVNFPHNPTGFLPSPDELERIVALCRERDVWLFSDEMYRGLELSGRQMLPSVGTLTDHSIVLSGLSKSYGLPGLRCGWLVIPDRELFGEVLNWKFYTSICPPGPIEYLGIAALAAREALVRKNKERIERHVALAAEFFTRWPETFVWRPPQAGSVALVGLDQPSATQYCHDLARDAGVVLLPSKFLGYDDHHVRFGFGREGFAEALEHFERHLESV